MRNLVLVKFINSKKICLHFVVDYYHISHKFGFSKKIKNIRFC